MNKGIANVKLVLKPIILHSKSEKYANGNRFGNMTEGIFEINAFMLMKAFSNKAGFLSINGTIRFPFDLKHLFAVYQILMWRRGHKSPGVCGLKSLKLFKHCLSPVSMFGGL
ncbi:hypothetical protein TB2_034179 [Malus domestica]